MLFKSYQIENNINNLRTNLNLFYGENVGLKDEFKNKIEENRKISLPMRREIRQYCKDNFDWCVIIEKYKEIIESI